MIKFSINTLNSNTINPKEDTLMYFTCKKLNNVKNWDEWKAGEKKQIDQSMVQGMFGDPINLIGLPRNTIYHVFIGNIFLSVQVFKSEGCAAMVQNTQLHSYMQWLVCGCHVLNYPYNDYF